MVQDRVNDKMLTTRARVQKVAGRLLAERNMTKTEVDEFFAIFGVQLRQHITDKESTTQLTLIELAQDAIDVALTCARPTMSPPSDLTVGPTARSTP